MELDKVVFWGLAVLLVVGVILGIYTYPSHTKQSIAGAGDFGAKDALTVRVYFGNSRLDKEGLGDKVFAVERRIPRTRAVAGCAIEELLKGPTDEETAQGYFTNINSGVKVKHLVIENKVAKVDFNEQLQTDVAGSSRVSAIRAQITQTLKQFPTVDEVIISINGLTKDILQP